MQETQVAVAELGRSPGGGNGNPLQYSCLENPKDRGAWWARATAHGVAKSGTGLKEAWPFICVRRVKKNWGQFLLL